MREYRLYCLYAGNLDLPDTIIAADDRTAIDQARELKRQARKCEIWQARRLVAILEADDLAHDSQAGMADASSAPPHNSAASPN